MKNYLLSRLREPSTWRGIVLLATAIGVPIQPDLQESIIATGLAVTGLIGVVTQDK